MAVEIGKTYKIDHSRKGKFTGRVLRMCSTWATVLVVDGHAAAMCQHNEAEPGEELTIRQAHATFTEI